MALEDMLRALTEEGEAECERALEQGKQRSSKVIEEARREAAETKEAHLKKAKLAFQAEKSRIINSANFFVKKEVIKAKEVLIADAFAEAEKRVGQIRQSSEYEAVFRKLAGEALANVEGEATVSVDKRDVELAKRVLDTMGKPYELKTDIECLGGLQVTTLDGRVTFVNTLDSRIAKATQFLKPAIAGVLFG